MVNESYLDKLDYGIRDLNKIYSNKIIPKEYKDNYDNYIVKKIDPPNYKPKNTPIYQPINWGRREVATSENAFVQPTSEEIKRVLEAAHMIKTLPVEQQRRLVEATREIRYFFDGQIRAKFGGTRHFNAIRCLNDPRRTDISTQLGLANTQLAGEEFFALNRFMVNYPDIADVQWWAAYQGGSWTLDTWNPEGEHLDTGFNGWGELVGSVMKVNGRVLNPTEMISFYRSMKLRNERGFLTPGQIPMLKYTLSPLKKSLPEKLAISLGEQLGIFGKRTEVVQEKNRLLDMAHDFGLVTDDGKSLTYVGESMLSEGVTARERKARQLTETDENVRRIIVPTIFG